MSGNGTQKWLDRVQNTQRLVLKKNCFSAWASTEYGFDQQRLIWYVCRLWDMVFRIGFKIAVDCWQWLSVLGHCQ